ncbi:alpha/beta-hydrolase [Dendrothele bispora CBS 962.96]|uniref:Alpha/beta-hydrolase n=1 Tax=Dendrothele bispora (strain CBS 962.96) TaxID=1314807 RepID=A0A4S8M4X1_DENBC|nr:alpha/beta-hydrolase [Dendrothele bispora CBS 962.96]
MPEFVLPNNIKFFYEDSGAPASQSYATFFIIHGHTFHSGLFKRIIPVAHARNYRMIVVNRREYPGSTPYTEEELKVFAEGPDDNARMKLLLSEGSNLALLLDGLIQSLSLPQSGGVAVAGWSLGSLYALLLLASITTLPQATKERLGSFVKSGILWDPPIHPLGIPYDQSTCYVPLWDPELSPQERAMEFGKWVTYYFVHGDLSQRDLTQLNFRTNDPKRKRTFEDLPFPELLQVIDMTPGPKCDTPVSESAFAKVDWAIMNKALLNPETRAAWPNMKVWALVGDASPWSIHKAVWVLEDESKKIQSPEPSINSKMIKDANHFVMWDAPESAMDALEICIKS